MLINQSEEQNSKEATKKHKIENIPPSCSEGEKKAKRRIAAEEIYTIICKRISSENGEDKRTLKAGE